MRCTGWRNARETLCQCEVGHFVPDNFVLLKTPVALGTTLFSGTRYFVLNLSPGKSAHHHPGLDAPSMTDSGQLLAAHAERLQKIVA